MRTDATRLRQILVNLLSNAIKFTARGEILVTVTSRPVEGDERVELELAVRDTGIGIPADRLDRLFRPFSQVDSSTTRLYGGTGLGLALSRRPGLVPRPAGAEPLALEDLRAALGAASARPPSP